MRPLLLFLAFASLHAQEFPPELKALTAQDVIAQIQSHVGVEWRKETVDTIKAGDPLTPVTGIATTMMATLDVLQRAAAANKNFIITHEPTFYSHLDRTATLESEADPTYTAKARFIADHHLVVFRFHDHWHMRNPDGILAGIVHSLKWDAFQQAEKPHLFTLPATTLNTLASYLRQTLNATAVRVIGDPSMPVTKVALSPGAGGTDGHRALLQRDDVEVLVIGEVPEWETQEYVADSVTEHRHKALIMLGHIPSEQAGMQECATWLKTFIKDVPVEYIPTSEPFFLAR